jgi:hypothetical protein
MFLYWKYPPAKYTIEWLRPGYKWDHIFNITDAEKIFAAKFTPTMALGVQIIMTEFHLIRSNFISKNKVKFLQEIMLMDLSI